MPTSDDKTVTLYNKNGDAQQFSGRAIGEAAKKGWRAYKPESSQPFTKPGFAAGLGAGINPFHQTPDNMPVPGTMGGIGRGAADAVNMREIFNRFNSGDKSGGAGQAIGTAASLLGPSEIGKGVKAAGKASRLLEVPGVAEAGDKAVKSAKELAQGVRPYVELAEKYVQPLRAGLNKKFNTLHFLLKDEAVPVTPKLEQYVNRLQKAEVPSVRNIGMELGSKAKGFLQHQGRSTLQYMEAEGYRRQLMRLAESAPEGWRNTLRDMSHELDAEIQKLADTKGVGPARTELKATSKDVEQVFKSTASDMREAGSKPKLRARVGPFHAQVYAGISHGEGVSEKTRGAAIKAAKKLNVPTTHFVKRTLAERAGTAAQVVGRGEQAGAIARGAISSGIGQEQPPQ